MGDAPLFRSRHRPRLVYERRPWLDGPRRRTRGRRHHRLDLRIPVAIFAAVALFVGLKGQGLLAGWAPKTCEVARLAVCYDGDTCDAFIEGRHQSVRLDGFDTPELNHNARCAKEQSLGLAARDRLRVLIAHAHDRQFCTGGSSFDQDRYGRVLATLELDGRDVASTMIEEGHAVPYSGGRRPNWCL